MLQAAEEEEEDEATLLIEEPKIRTWKTKTRK